MSFPSKELKEKPWLNRGVEYCGFPKSIVKNSLEDGIKTIQELYRVSVYQFRLWHKVGKRRFDKTEEIIADWKEQRERKEVTHVVMYSGGVGSYITAKRVIEKHGRDNVVLLFTDTKMEDPTLYTFLDDSAELLDVPLIKIADGRDVWEVFFDKQYLGNWFADPCSKILKRDLADSWIEDNHSPFSTVCYLGIDWTEIHRYETAKKRKAPYIFDAPLTRSTITRDQMLQELKDDGLALPSLYKEGFPHNNCGGFCIKAGQAHFEHLYKKRPELYKFHEEKEQEFREVFEKDVAILTRTEDGEKKPFTLRMLRQEVEQGCSIDKDDWGGCGCFV